MVPYQHLPQNCPVSECTSTKLGDPFRSIHFSASHWSHCAGRAALPPMVRCTWQVLCDTVWRSPPEPILKRSASELAWLARPPDPPMWRVAIYSHTKGQSYRRYQRYGGSQTHRNSVPRLFDPEGQELPAKSKGARMVPSPSWSESDPPSCLHPSNPTTPVTESPMDLKRIWRCASPDGVSLSLSPASLRSQATLPALQTRATSLKSCESPGNGKLAT